MNWEIIDREGTIHSGTEEEMKRAFDCMTKGFKDIMKEYDVSETVARNWKRDWTVGWIGDLKLVQIHKIEK